MGSKRLVVVILIFSVFTFFIFTFQNDGTSNWFVEYPLPLEETHRFFDMGVVDANGDDLLDIYTTNHHFRIYRKILK